MKDEQTVKRSTSRDVARLAGVSQATVSFVINGVETERISEETRARVLEAAAQLHYHPHDGARQMRQRATRMIGLVVPEANNLHHVETAAGVEQYAKQQGYSVFRTITNFRVEEEKRSIQLLKERRFDALILSLTTGDIFYHELGHLSEQGYCVTGLGFDYQDINTVRSESEVGERQVIEHLVELGHRRIGYIYGVCDQFLQGGRLETCLNIQRELGLPIVDSWVRRCGPTQEEGYQTTQQLLADCGAGERPTALVVVNDLLASAVIPALFAAHIPVPEAMSVISFDNTPHALYTWPPLTTVDCEACRMGQEAARLTVERLNGYKGPPVHVYTRCRLIVRASTAPPPSSS